MDPTFATNFQGMQDAGIIRGAYHFARPGSDAKTQADFFVDTVISAGGYNASRTMQLVLDLEAADDLSAAEVWAWVQTWTAQVKQRTGRPPIICESLVSLSANSILTLMHSCTSDFTRADTGYYFWNDSVGHRRITSTVHSGSHHTPPQHQLESQRPGSP